MLHFKSMQEKPQYNLCIGKWILYSKYYIWLESSKSSQVLLSTFLWLWTSNLEHNLCGNLQIFTELRMHDVTITRHPKRLINTTNKHSLLSKTKVHWLVKRPSIQDNKTRLANRCVKHDKQSSFSLGYRNVPHVMQLRIRAICANCGQIPLLWVYILSMNPWFRF